MHNTIVLIFNEVQNMLFGKINGLAMVRKESCTS